VRAALGLILGFVVACGGSTALPAASAPPSPSVVAATSAGPSVTSTSAPTSTSATSPVLRTTLIDVRTGERFTLGGFTGKTVIVEGMAVW
jgi:hypothetical protein